MRKRLQQKAADIREMQARLFGDDVMGTSQDPDKAGDTQMGNSKGGVEEVEPLSVFVGNVDYACTVDEVHQHFEGCGTVNRVTILSDKYGQPKGFAYVEFVDEEAVDEALGLNESELHGRKLKVMRKRKNVPGMKQRRPRHFNPYVAYGYEPSVPPYFYSPYGVYGHFPRFRKPQ